jgi:hypothetical protein
MASTDTDYTATGEDSPGDTQVAFETKLDGNIEIGVGVVGTKCGVYGQSRNYQRLFNTNTRDARDDAGVIGSGNTYGVLGESLERGVIGIVTPKDGNVSGNSIGVLGEGHLDCPGVGGLCFAGDNINFGAGPGVIGVSNANSRVDPSITDPSVQWGAGVVGLSVTKGTLESVPLSAVKHVTELGDGTGVWGASGGGIGVHGRSESGRGGVFESTKSSQLQLVPTERPVREQAMTTVTLTPHFPVLPNDGEAGDMSATLEQEPDGTTGGTSLQARLWFCVRSNSTSRPAGWAQVLLGDTFDGG